MATFPRLVGNVSEAAIYLTSWSRDQSHSVYPPSNIIRTIGNYVSLLQNQQAVGEGGGGALSQDLTKTTFTRLNISGGKFSPRIAYEDHFLGRSFSLVQGCPSPILLHMIEL